MYHQKEHLQIQECDTDYRMTETILQHVISLTQVLFGSIKGFYDPNCSQPQGGDWGVT